MDWASKYRPKHMDEVVGNSTALRQMVEWGRTWTRESRPLILYGKPGTGKTSSVYALAADLNWEVIELNASDQRTKDVILRIAGTSSQTGSLTGAERKVILLDEADNLHGTADRGGARAILEVIRTARQPVILIANDLYQIPAEIRSRSDPVQFRALPARSIVPRLRFICSSEHLSCGDEALKDIAEAAHGDMRAAITMLEAAAIGREALVEADISTSRKDERSTIFDLVAAVFGKPGGEDLMKISYEVDETPDTLAQWIEANLGHINDADRYSRAYQCLARSDEYIGLTFRHQYYTLWRYASLLMILGVSDAAGGAGIHARIQSPERWRKMGSYRKQKAVRTGMLDKVSSGLHMSQHSLRDTYLSLVSALADRDPTTFARDFSLDSDELNLLIHDKARAQKVVKTLADEEKKREKEREAAEKREQKRAAAATPGAEDADRRMSSPDSKNRQAAGAPEQAGPSQEEPEKDKKSQKTLFDGF
ncbi:MAG: replication factor C large subunit [Methanomicrobiales archaeon]|nr:replication factor C large subunit [Methanomicrobiales archaeon]NYT20568.1 replication factor C large subunit [Methanomicrobiales archaeon]